MLTYGTAYSVGVHLSAHERYRTVQHHVGVVGKEEVAESVLGEWIKSKNADVASKAATQHGSDVRPPLSSLGRLFEEGLERYDSQLVAERLPIIFLANAFHRDVHVVRDVTCRFKIETFRLLYSAK